MYHKELVKCKRLAPSPPKSVNSFRSYDALNLASPIQTQAWPSQGLTQVFQTSFMYHLELGKCKRLTPSTSKLVNSFRSYDTSKIRGQNWNGEIKLFCHLSCPGNFSLLLPSPMARDCSTNGQGTPLT